MAVSKSLPLNTKLAIFFEHLEDYTLKEMVERCLDDKEEKMKPLF